MKPRTLVFYPLLADFSPPGRVNSGDCFKHPGAQIFYERGPAACTRAGVYNNHRFICIVVIIVDLIVMRHEYRVTDISRGTVAASRQLGK